MNRIRVGIGILSALLILSLAASVGMQRIYPAMADQLQQAADLAESGNFAEARVLAARASRLWERFYRFTAALADHAPMDDMDSLFAELETYAALEEIPHFAALCRNLSRLAHSMGENHGMQWWNLL